MTKLVVAAHQNPRALQDEPRDLYKNLSAPHLSLRCLSTFLVKRENVWTISQLGQLPYSLEPWTPHPYKHAQSRAHFRLDRQRESTSYTHPHQNKHAHAHIDDENRHRNLTTFTHFHDWPIFHMFVFISIISNRAIVCPRCHFCGIPYSRQTDAGSLPTSPLLANAISPQSSSNESKIYCEEPPEMVMTWPIRSKKRTLNVSK